MKMNWVVHRHLSGKHAFLAPSKGHWVNYDPIKLKTAFDNHNNKALGTELHALAESLIRHGLKMAPLKKTLNAFVNDAIKHGLDPEVTLYYSDNCFGTADAISFDVDENTGVGYLNVWDLKTGNSEANRMQLIIYVALFCLEYGVDPRNLVVDLRIYQHGTYKIIETDEEEILFVMGKIMESDKIIDDIKRNQ